MGTNYYAVKKEPCLYDRKIHIGKASCGWKFAFHDCERFHSFPQFQDFLKEHIDTGEYVILDEYEREWSSRQMLDIIESKQKTPNPDDFAYGENNVDGYKFVKGDFC